MTSLRSYGRSKKTDYQRRDDICLPENEAIDPENWNFSNADTQYLLHNLHPYPAKFIPQIARRAIERWSKPGETILDPFCGSGTALLESALLGRNSIGVDNNGVATLISRAKTLTYSDYDLELFSEKIKEVERETSNNSAYWKDLVNGIDTRPFYKGVEKWFDEWAIKDLSWLRHKIQQLPDPAFTLAMAVFSSIIVQVSKQDSDTRYTAIDRPYKHRSAISKWIDKAIDSRNRARETTDERKGVTNHLVYTRDSRDLSIIKSNSVDLIVTSPPYINAYDYHKYHRHRLQWIFSDIGLARDNEIGKHDIFSRPNASPEAYFEDIERCFHEWNKILKPGAKVFLVVGDGIVNKKLINVADRIINVSNVEGFFLIKRWVRNIDPYRKSFNSSSRMLREHLLLFGNS